ncbi:TonB-dependent receptor [Brevundimonas sp.]|uniref:TonB-dependent receptor n=1 Tax=Brevundimonas sp. TaxID=1871086 RepID=UPI0019972805|nr:TonB-dependent receptor [Brevundimonas sp.]MBD3836813.1 TonB-dependent receptor [Brevundimonas sp.]
MNHHRRHGLGAAALAAIVALAPSFAGAQEARVFDIAAGPLETALAAFAIQSDHQILFTTDLVAGRTTAGVSGRMTTTAALERMLAGSGLGWTQTQPGVIVLRRAALRETASAPAAVDDVIVTGSLLRQSGELASPVHILDRDALDRSGRATVAEVVAELPQNYAGSATPASLLGGVDNAGSNTAVATGVNLRGLGPDATLVLVNGRRMAGSGYRGDFADLSAIPSVAVERVDVLLDGASALYGSDAVAGVVNLILRRNVDGQESRLRASAAKGGGEDLAASHLVGRTWSSGSALLAYEYQHTQPLSSFDRPYSRDGDLRPFGGTDWRSIFASPGNIVEYDAGLGAYVATYGIRPSASGRVETPADFSAGAPNLDSVSQGVDLAPGQERHGVYGRIVQDVGGRLSLEADVRFSARSFAFATTPVSTVFQVTSANPWFVSPNGQSSHTLAYSFYDDLGASPYTGDSRSLGLTFGADYDIGGGWSAEAYVALAEERGETNYPRQLNTARLNEALGNVPDDPNTAYDPARDGYFNPFAAGGVNPREVLDFIASGYIDNVDRGRAASANILIEGPLLTLPGGEARLALGVQARRESFATRAQSFTSTAVPRDRLVPEQSRDVAAVFGEARLPLVGEANARLGLQRLELSIAGRLEEYSDFGSTANPKVGLIYAPTPDLTLRASYGTSFRAPALPQIFDDSLAGATLVPTDSGARLLSIYLTGGNRDLEPETAETFTAGFTYRRDSGLRVSAGYFDTAFSDRIAQPVREGLSRVLTDPSLAPFVTEVDPANNAADRALIERYITAPGFSLGTLFPAEAYRLILDARWVNAASVHVRGFDAEAAYPFDWRDHSFRLTASASYMLDYLNQTTPTAARENLVGVAGYPTDLRGRIGLDWSRGDLAAGLTLNHVADYRDASGGRIDAWNTLDARLAWSPSRSAGGFSAVISVRNLLDADPPFYDVSTGFGYDPAQADIFGRVVALQLIKRW